MKDDDDEHFEVLSRKAVPATIDEYMLGLAPDVRAILQKVREAVRNAAPDAEEVISYRMPAFKLNGIIVYFAAFKKHIGLYPPVKGDARLELAVAPYAGPKGNLKFPLDEPIPFDLIERIARFRLKQNLARIGSKGRRAKEQEPAR
jgi:uncharacterized protein YdhG (YjbR/CyaY superfamily)